MAWICNSKYNIQMVFGLPSKYRFTYLVRRKNEATLFADPWNLYVYDHAMCYTFFLLSVHIWLACSLNFWYLLIFHKSQGAVFWVSTSLTVLSGILFFNKFGFSNHTWLYPEASNPQGTSLVYLSCASATTWAYR